jgi:hypothetical protein
VTIPVHRHGLKHGTAAEWTAANPILALGEEGYETDTKLRKVGDGVTAYNSLAYQPGGVSTVAGVSPVSSDVPAVGLATALQTAGLAPKASPALTGTPTAPTPTPGDNTTKVSTTAFVAAAIAALVNSSPSALDTLKELADALGDDANFATTITNALALKAPISTTTIDLVDRTNNTTETVPAGTTTNCSTVGVTKTAPSLDNPVATPPKRFAVKNLSTGTITVSYPDQSGAAQNLVMLSGETRTFRQKSTSGWGVESGAIAVATLDGRFQPLDADLTAIAALAPSDGQVLSWSTSLGAWTITNPTGTSELAYAENNTGTTQTGLTTAAADLTNCSISVPASTRPVYLHGYLNTFASAAPTNAGPGMLITEVSNGVDTPVTIGGFGTAYSLANKTSLVAIPATRLAASTARTRTFKGQWAGSGSGTWTVEHGSNNRRSVVAAEAR